MLRFDNLFGIIFFIFPVSVLVFYFLSKKVFKQGVYLPSVGVILQSFSIKIFMNRLFLFLMIFSLFLIAFSLLKPKYGVRKDIVEYSGIDICIVLDISPSMTIRDYGYSSRIDIAKGILNNFIDRRKGDRFSLVTFSTYSMLRCPSTFNYSLLKRLINKININPDEQASTSIGLGLASGINRLLSLEDNKNINSKIIILVTDGKNNSGEISPETALQIAKEKGIKIYSIGLGQDDEIDHNLLKNISQTTGGEFFYANDVDSVKDAFNQIDKLEKQKLKINKYSRFNYIGYQLAVIGGLIFLFSFICYSFFFRRVL